MNEITYACSLTDEERAARRDEWKGLGERTLVSAETRPGGRLLVYRGGAETAAAISALVAAERDCCPFIEFDVEQKGDEVHVTLRFPPDQA